MAYSGLTAKMTVDGATVAYVSNFSVEQTRDVTETSYLGEDAKEKSYGLYSWTASADGTADFVGDAAQAALHNAMKNRKTVNVVFYLNTTEGAIETLSGTGLIESLSLEMSAEDKGSISIGISGKCFLTYAAPAQQA